MKRLSLAALAAATLALTTASAQIGVGFQGGFINSNVTYEQILNGDTQEFDTDGINAWTIGVPVEIQLSKAFALQPEVNLLRRGYDFGQGNIAGGKVEYTVVSIPVLAKLGYVGSGFTAAATFGPAFQYVASGQTTLSLAGQETETKIDFDSPDADDFNRTSVYGIVGAQAGFPLGFGKFVVDGRYRFQLNDEEGSDDVEVRGRGISATAGLIFTLGSY